MLIEISIAIAIIAMLSGMTATLIVVAQRNQISARRQDAASGLMSEAYSILRSLSTSDSTTSTSGYNRIYCPPHGVCPPLAGSKGIGTTYKPVLIGDHWELESGSEQVTLSNVQYTRFVTIENVCRDVSGDIVGSWSTSVAADCPNGGVDTDDPSVQKVSVTLQAPRMRDLTASLFLTRWRNTASGQSDWSGGVAEASGIGESVIHFQITVADPQPSELVRVFACKTDGIDGVSYSCPGGVWAESTGWKEIMGSGTVDLYYTPTEADVATSPNDAYLFSCDDEGACSSAAICPPLTEPPCTFSVD